MLQDRGSMREIKATYVLNPHVEALRLLRPLLGERWTQIVERERGSDRAEKQRLLGLMRCEPLSWTQRISTLKEEESLSLAPLELCK